MKTALTVVLLAGGESTRFWPLTEKNHSHFFGKPLLQLHFEQLVALHIQNVVVVTQKKNTSLLKSTPVPSGLTVTYVTQEAAGQGQAVRAFMGVVKNGPILILNASDYYADSFLTSFLRHIDAKGEEMMLGAVEVVSYFPGGYLKINAKGYIEEIVEKPTPGKEPSNIVRIVADYVPEASLLAKAVEQHGEDPASGYETAINALIQSGVACKAQITSLATWKYLKNPWDVLSLAEEFLSKLEGQLIDKSVMIQPNVIIDGPVIIESGVKIFEGTKIVGPCYIGKNTIIGNNNLIRSSMIGNDCVTGFNTDITRSYIGNTCWFHSNYIGDSVLENDISLGAGTVLANLRLDEGEVTSVVKDQKLETGRSKLGAMIGSHVRIGVNASVMPGIKIGSNSCVAAGVVLGQDIQENSFVTFASKKLSIVQNTKQVSSRRDEFRNAL